MAEGGDASDFDKSRAELFEALGHPVRIKILHALQDGPLGFADLKRRVGIESSGHLQFHLNKLDGLVKMTLEGLYAMSDDGHEALRITSTLRGASLDQAGDGRRIVMSRAVLAGLIAVLLLLASAVVIQELKITDLSNEMSSLNQQLTPTGGIRVVSAEMASLNTPAGPTVTITLQNEMGQNVTSLRAVLELAMDNYTYSFAGVSLSNPLKQGQSASDTEILINGGFSAGEAYPLVIEGATQDLNFTYVTSTEITTG